MICHEQDQSQSANPSKLNVWFVGSLTLLHFEGHNSFIRNAIEANEYMMEILFDNLSNGFILLQYHVGKASKSSRHAVVVSAECYDIVMSLLFTLGILAQVGACLNHVENTPRNTVDILPLGHHLRRSARASKPS